MSGAHYGATMDNGNWPWTNTWRSNQFKDDLSWIKGAHNFKFGVAWLYGHKNQQIFIDTAGTYQFDGKPPQAPTVTRGHPWRRPCGLPAGLCHQFQPGTVAGFRLHRLQYARCLCDGRLARQQTADAESGPPLGSPAHAFDTNNRMSNFYPELCNPAQAAQFTSPTSGALNTSGPGFTTVAGIKLSTVPFYLNGVGLLGRNGIPKGLADNHWSTSLRALALPTMYSETGRRFCAADAESSTNATRATKSTTWAPTCRSATAAPPFRLHWHTRRSPIPTDRAPDKSPTTPQGFTGVQKKYSDYDGVSIQPGNPATGAATWWPRWLCGQCL